MQQAVPTIGLGGGITQGIAMSTPSASSIRSQPYKDSQARGLIQQNFKPSVYHRDLQPSILKLQVQV